MLLLVLVIMAVAVILITSALTITVKGRQRFYMDSQSSQARLTVTSAAKSIADAIVSADFKSIDLENLAAANGGAGTTVNVQSAQSASPTALSAGTDKTKAVAPGLYGSGSSQSFTNAVIKYYPSVTNQQYISVKVTTGLDIYGNASANTESVTVYLQKLPITVPSDAFGNLVTLGGASSTNNLPQIRIGYDLQQYRADGTFVRSTGPSNYTVVHGNVSIAPSGGQQLYCDMIYTGQVTLGGGTNFYGNQIFSGNSASIKASSAGNGIIANGANILFLGDTTLGLSSFSTDAGLPTSASSSGNGVEANITGTTSSLAGGIYLLNSSLQSSLNSNYVRALSAFVVDSGSQLQFTGQWYTPSSTVYLASTTASGFYTPTTASTNYPAYVSATDSVPIVVTLRALAAKYTTPAMIAQTNRQILTQAQALAANLTVYNTQNAAFNTAISNGSITTLTAADLTAAGTRTYTGTAYCIDASSTNIVGSSGWSSQTMLNFDLINNDITLYIYGNGNTLTFASGLFNFINGGTHVGRICLMDGVDLVMNQNNYSYDIGIIGSNHQVVSGAQTQVVYNSPIFLYIYGMNNNQITANQKDTIEGYFGLYGANGTLTLGNGPFFYGRVESSILVYGGGDPMSFPYCPSPSESLGSVGGMTSVSSSYKVAGYQYS